MSFVAIINSNDKNNKISDISSEKPRWFTQEGRAYYDILRAKTRITPQESYCMNQTIIGLSTSNSCVSCISNAPFSYQSGRSGGSPY